MPIAPNLLRSQVEDFEQTPSALSARQLARRDRILHTGRHLFALHGFRNLRVCDLAIALNITAAAIRHHFADLDALLIEIIHNHNNDINDAIGAVHRTHPDAVAKRRTAYLAITRGPSGGLTEAHLLLTRDAAMLSETNYNAIQESHHQHGIILAGKLDADIALTLLDAPRLDPVRIHAMLATLEGTDPVLLVPVSITPEIAAEPSAPQQSPQPQAAPEPAWSDGHTDDHADDLADDLIDPFQTYPDGQTPGAWVFNPGCARAPPNAA